MPVFILTNLHRKKHTDPNFQIIRTVEWILDVIIFVICTNGEIEIDYFYALSSVKVPLHRF